MTACRDAGNRGVFADGGKIAAIGVAVTHGVTMHGFALNVAPDLSHFDLIKIHGHRPCGDVRSIINETLDFIRSRDLAIELSTAGWRKPVNELYPGDRIIELAIEKKIPFTTASDAHSHAQLAENFQRLAEKMSILGIRGVCVYEKHQRERRKL